MLVDTHGHLDDERFDADRDAVMERAIEAGVAFIINPGTDLDSSRLAVELAEKHDCVYAALGVHPHESGQLTDKACAVLRKLADHEKVVAIGEIGLDYYREFSPREDQREAFRKQLDIASELALPVIVHSRDAHAEVEEMLGEAGRAGKLRGVLHCFSGSPEWAQRAVAMGFHIGFDGPVTYENATKLRKIAAAVPDERLLVETDCPYLPPVPHKRSERNEPAYVRLVAERLAGIRKVSYEDICRVTGLAAARLFGIPSADESGKVAYVIRNSLYLNITNRCSNRCTFCTRQKNAYVKGHRLWLDREPSVEGIIAACGDISHYDEVVFCGYGEPTERLDALKEVAKWVKSRGQRVRIVTNGEGDLINGRPIAAELAGLVDKLSVSVNTADPEQYDSLCRSVFGPKAHPAILKFIEGAKAHVPEIEITAVSCPGVDIKAVELLAKKMGVAFRARRYNDAG
ncbi:MAG: hydrolase TatD [Planctomycetes bacterium SM23_65]|nr:MAG: hydrolase TatD [Planctomycetes bacterium SM23_65]